MDDNHSETDVQFEKQKQLEAYRQALQTQALFELEEYKQVIEERRFVMTRYIQGVGLYLVLSGFVLQQLISLENTAGAWLLTPLYTAFNILAICGAGRFRKMAALALEREKYFVQKVKIARSMNFFGATRWG